MTMSKGNKDLKYNVNTYFNDNTQWLHLDDEEEYGMLLNAILAQINHF